MDYASILQLEKLRAEEAALEADLITEYRQLQVEGGAIGLRLDRATWRVYDRLIAEDMATTDLLASFAYDNVAERQSLPDWPNQSFEESFRTCVRYYAELWEV